MQANDYYKFTAKASAPVAASLHPKVCPDRTQLGPRDRSRRERLRDSHAEAHGTPARGRRL